MTLGTLAFAVCTGSSFFVMAQKDDIDNEQTEVRLRVARPTDNLKEVLKFYRDGLGLDVLTSFNHLGYEGQILGRKGSPYHLEFLHQHGRKFGKASTQENLLVFFMPDAAEWRSAVERMRKHGYQPVKSANPGWDKNGKTFEDIDGYRVVLQKASEMMFRVARPTDNLKEVLKFYRDGLGLEVLTSFNHLGYEGEILGRKGSSYHLEFLHQHGQKFGKAPTHENLLVFYIPDKTKFLSAVERMIKHGYQSKQRTRGEIQMARPSRMWTATAWC